MASLNNEKMKIMEDEMNRFEEEIGMPNAPGIVIGTNTFSQAQQKIHEITRNTEPDDDGMMQAPQNISSVVPPASSFIPHQLMNRSQAPRGQPMPSGMSSGPPRSGLPFPPRPPPMFGFFPPMVPGMTRTGMPSMPGFCPPNMYPGVYSPAGLNMPMSSSKEGVPLNRKMNEHRGETKVVLSATPKLYINKLENDMEVSKEEDSKWTSQDINDGDRQSKMAKNKTTAKEMVESVKSSTTVTTIGSSTEGSVPVQPTGKKKEKKPKKCIRVSGGQTWEDSSLAEWEDGDFRLFCGDLGNDVTDELLTRIFSRYPSFLKARVVRDKRTNKTKGFGFISFKDPQDFIRATKEMNGRYVGSRPIKLRKSTWRNRNVDIVKKKEKEKAALIALLTGH